jgi:hypothetical protein
MSHLLITQVSTLSYVNLTHKHNVLVRMRAPWQAVCRDARDGVIQGARGVSTVLEEADTQESLCARAALIRRLRGRVPVTLVLQVGCLWVASDLQ